ncbi:MAG: hypothetical protein K8M05_38550 [Deltaproteobacteria bacterium]|nr:hypothetical protein [Kofleriaceae bacterium]
MIVRLRDVLGAHLANPAELRRLEAYFAVLVIEEGVLGISFDGIESLTPSFSTALLLMIDSWRRSVPHVRIRMVDLTVRTRATVEASRSALQASPAEAPLDARSLLVRQFTIPSSYGCAKGSIFAPIDPGPLLYAFNVHRLDDGRRVGQTRLLDSTGDEKADEERIREMIQAEILRRDG